ncbi:hypothetical protein HYC85_027422 [Camellia sinensis]|uniref:beta-galactosidase n=1 Tax=Camellia sinensis TaxID=4442 RepID=A0A7J7G6C7_CAMSI|nr:hypothetical protein HYC85_027422 [Camellia sinensis]
MFLNSGFPLWLHFIPGIQFRTDNEPFKAEMKQFTAKIVDMMKQENSMHPKADPLSYPSTITDAVLVKNYDGKIAQSHLYPSQVCVRKNLDWPLNLSIMICCNHILFFMRSSLIMLPHIKFTALLMPNGSDCITFHPLQELQPTKTIDDLEVKAWSVLDTKTKKKGGGKKKKGMVALYPKKTNHKLWNSSFKHANRIVLLRTYKPILIVRKKGDKVEASIEAKPMDAITNVVASKE